MIKRTVVAVILAGVALAQQSVPSLNSNQIKELHKIQAKILQAQVDKAKLQVQGYTLERNLQGLLQQYQARVQEYSMVTGCVGCQLTDGLVFVRPQPAKDISGKTATQGDKSPAVSGNGNTVEVK